MVWSGLNRIVEQTSAQLRRGSSRTLPDWMRSAAHRAGGTLVEPVMQSARLARDTRRPPPARRSLASGRVRAEEWTRPPYNMQIVPLMVNMCLLNTCIEFLIKYEYALKKNILSLNQKHTIWRAVQVAGAVLEAD